MPLPNAKARREILRIHLRGPAYAQPADIEPIVDQLVPATKGFSGARLQHLCQDAKRLAVRSVAFAQAVPPTLEQACAALDMELNDHDSGGQVDD